MRQIEPLTLEGPAAVDHGPVPELRWIEIAALQVDESYQRPISALGERTVRAIARGFDWRMFGPVVVSPVEGGIFAIVDGQHRTTAAAMCGIERVPCLVIQANRPMQARAFGAINGRVTPITSIALFRSRVTAGEPKALEIRAICETAEITILGSLRTTSQMKARETIACHALERQLALVGREVLATALRMIVAAAHDRPGLIVPVTIQGFCEVLQDHADWRAHPGVVDVCRGLDLDSQLLQAREDARAKRMPVLPFVEAFLVTHLYAKLRQMADA